MKKLWVLMLTMLFVFASVGTALSESGKSPENISIQYGELNKIPIPKGASTVTFAADIMGTGTEQTIKISKNKYGDYNIIVSQQDEILTSLNFMPVINSNIIRGSEQWYLAYLRGTNAPDIVYSFIDGSGAFLNDLKIFGFTEKHEIDKLFDAKPLRIPEKIGGQTQLSIKDTQLILTGQRGTFPIILSNNN